MHKVALLTQNNGGGGAALAVSRLARGLSLASRKSQKFDFTLLVSALQEKDFFVKKKRIKNNIKPLNNFTSELLDKIIARAWAYIHGTKENPRLFYMQGYRNVCDDLLGFDVVNMFWMQGLADLSNFKNFRKPLVVTLHDMWFLTGGCSYSFGCNKFWSGCKDCDFIRAPLKRDARNQYSAKHKILSDSKTRVVVTSRWMYEAAVDRGIEDSRITIIKNYIPSNYHFFDDRDIARDLLGLDDQLKAKKIFYFVGSTSDPRKGFDLFCEAIKMLSHSSRKEILVMHLGPVDKSKDFLFNELGIDLIHLGSFTDEISQIIAYNAADFLICPSRYDNTPNVIAESHMCGLPVISANTSGCAEMVSHAENGLLANVEIASEFVSSIDFALKYSSSFSRKSICENARLKYGYNATCDKYLDLYRSML